jgi:hypothetical protein
MRETSHAHDWGPLVAVDRCHTTDEVRTCRGCGDQRVDFEVRDFTEPGAVAFADPNCATCRKMVAQAGAWPDAWNVMHLAQRGE